MAPILLCSIILSAACAEDDVNPYGKAQPNSQMAFKPQLGPNIKENGKCTAPNTKANSKGKCVCIGGFPDGDPALSTGCYKCPSKCHELANCVYPGRCKCQYGFAGDGVSACNAPPPELIKIFPDHSTVGGPASINVTYRFDELLNVSSLFCKIGGRTSPCRMSANGHGICEFLSGQIPASGTYELAISFDNKSWSSELLEFIVESSSSASSLQLLLFLIPATGVALALYAVKKRSSRKKIRVEQERLP